MKEDNIPIIMLWVGLVFVSFVFMITVIDEVRIGGVEKEHNGLVESGSSKTFDRSDDVITHWRFNTDEQQYINRKYYCTTKKFEKILTTQPPACGFAEDVHGNLTQISGEWYNNYWLEESEL